MKNNDYMVKAPDESAITLLLIDVIKEKQKM